VPSGFNGAAAAGDPPPRKMPASSIK
jgi:hypothetical protein